MCAIHMTNMVALAWMIMIVHSPYILTRLTLFAVNQMAYHNQRRAVASEDRLSMIAAFAKLASAMFEPNMAQSLGMQLLSWPPKPSRKQEAKGALIENLNE